VVAVSCAQVEVSSLVLTWWRRWPQLDPFHLTWWTPAPGSAWQSRLYDVLNTVVVHLHGPVQYLAYGLLAGILSSVVVGLYLVVASLFGLNFNELFSSQGIEGYKNFLRLHIDPRGTLTIYAIGVRRVRGILPGGLFSLHWKAQPDAPRYAPWFVPRRALKPKLIETVTVAGTWRPPDWTDSP
jgi:hypothetical protein